MSSPWLVPTDENPLKLTFTPCKYPALMKEPASDRQASPVGPAPLVHGGLVS